MVAARGRAVGRLRGLLTFKKKECIPNDVTSLIEFLETNVGVDLPGGKDDVFLSVGPTPPEDVTKIWLQTTVQGNPLGFNKWQGERWDIILGIGASWPQWILGDPSSPPQGWTTLDAASGYGDFSSAFTTSSSGLTLYAAIYTGKIPQN